MTQNDQTIHLDLMLGDRQAAVCRALPEAVSRAAERLYGEFRESSAARGLAMNDQEIRTTCWAPLAARLTDDAAGDAALVEPALSFLVTAAYRHLEAGAAYTVAIAADGTVSVTRRPRRLLGRNRVVLGNYRRAMGTGSVSAALAS